MAPGTRPKATPARTQGSNHGFVVPGWSESTAAVVVLWDKSVHAPAICWGSAWGARRRAVTGNNGLAEESINYLGEFGTSGYYGAGWRCATGQAPRLLGPGHPSLHPPTAPAL